ncbi:AAA family ATPase [Microbacterium sp. NPDC056234]|uniref:AAA family ATPase n=1 Tax=Microbacterium sp. NPDC056234 TaxID=3345757 RepID=UPI0035DF7419
MVKPPSTLIKEALVAAATYGEGNSAVVGDPQAAAVWVGFQDILRRLFPQSLGFKRLYVDQGELIVDTQSGDFALEGASGGLSAIVTLSWQIYLHAVDYPEAFTVCFDEPENHLHPSLQRTLVPDLLKAFPTVRFVVSTHSPFVVTSTREAVVYALRRTTEGSVFSQRINLEDQAFTADEVLNEVLGVEVTLPVWAEHDLEEILTEFTSGQHPISLEDLLSRLESAGLKVSMPDVTDAVATAIESRQSGIDR